MDPAAFGLPTGFGTTSQSVQHSIQASAKEKLAQTKRPQKKSTKGKEKSVQGQHQPSNAAETPSESREKVENKETVREDEVVDEEGEGDELETVAFPISHEVLLQDHTKPVTALAVDPSGARIISGGYDYDLKLWDFGGMDSGSFRPFRSWEGFGNYFIHDAAWNQTGSHFIACSGTWCPKLFNRDGDEQAEYLKGDMYLRDLRNTNGHVATVTGLQWHPIDPTWFISSSEDSTVRIWDVESKRKSKQVIVVKSKERGTRTRISRATWSTDGKIIAAAGLDGTLHLWNASSNFARPNHTVEKAHEKNTHTSSILFSVDGHSMYTRGGDDTVKMWDTRSFKKPVIVKENIKNEHNETNLCFSPDEKYILTGTGTGAGEEGKDGNASVEVFNKTTLELDRSISVGKGCAIRTVWHPRINQILVSLSSSSIHVLYSPTTSIRGATLSLSRLPRQRAVEDIYSHLTAPIFTPHFREDGPIPDGGLRESGEGKVTVKGSSKRKREKERMDPVKSHRPEPPVVGPGKGGRVGASATQHIVRGLVRDSMRDEDPREALLKYARKEGEPEDEASNWTKAWEKTQPKPVFDETAYDEEDEHPKKKKHLA